MLFEDNDRSTGGIFITFSGNCRKALSFYQTCFGGTLHFKTFDHELHGYRETPVIHGSLISPCIVIHGSDLVHNEGRKIGNYLSIFLPCKNTYTRKALLEKLGSGSFSAVTENDEDSLIEVTDTFDVKWVLGL